MVQVDPSLNFLSVFQSDGGPFTPKAATLVLIQQVQQRLPIFQGIDLASDGVGKLF